MGGGIPTERGERQARRSLLARPGIQGRSGRVAREVLRRDPFRSSHAPDPLESACAVSETPPHIRLPAVDAWARRIREDSDAVMSLALARGLLLLARLAEGPAASLTELAGELDIPLTSTGKYLETLMAAGLVERDPDTLRHGLVR